jgi:hypothetical protein
MPHTSVAVGQEYRIPAKPDSAWLETIAVAMGSSSGIVLWTEDGPKAGEATIRFARLGSDGHPLDAAGALLLENGHNQRHIAVDAYGDQFVAAWCDVTVDTKNIVAIRLDRSGHAFDAIPTVIAENIGNSEPEVGVTCNDGGCVVTWSDNGGYGSLPIGAVSAKVFSVGGKSASSVLQLVPKGIGNGVGTDRLNFSTAYAEPVTYGQSGAFVMKSILADGTSAETELLESSPNQIGSTWMAWSGSQWVILMLDLTTTGELAQEFRFMRVDRTGHATGNAVSTLLESAGVPLLCPWIPDLFLYDPQARRVVWDGTNFLAFTPRAIIPVGADGRILDRIATDGYFPRSYRLAISSSGNGRTIAAYSRDSAIAIRAIAETP